MDRTDGTEKGQNMESRAVCQEPATVEVVRIDAEIEIEDQPEPLTISVVLDERFEETVRAQLGMTEEMLLFEHGQDQPLSQPPHGRSAICLMAHRCRAVTTRIHYDHRTLKHVSAPAVTVFKVLQWAVSKEGFKLDPVAAAKANLILPGADAPLPRDSALGKHVKPGDCELVVNLTLKDFTNG